AIGAVAPYPALQQMSTPSPVADAELPNRLAYYAKHAAEFNLVFFGDSRTFTDVHPHLVNAYLGTNSLNLEQFSNWFPTQRAFIGDFYKLVPSKTTVVWSVGRQNFFSAGIVNHVYPVSLASALRYRLIGIDERGLFDNVFFYSPI